MSKTWLRKIKIPFSEYEIGQVHAAYNISSEQCESDAELDGCVACAEEFEEAGDLAIKKIEEQDLEFVDIICTNRPGLQMDEDRSWEFEIVVKRPD